MNVYTLRQGRPGAKKQEYGVDPHGQYRRNMCHGLVKYYSHLWRGECGGEGGAGKLRGGEVKLITAMLNS